MSAVVASLSIELRLRHRQGRAVDGVLHIPAAGCGLAEALALGGERLDTAQWHAANQCRIVRDGEGWQLVNDCETLVCSVNGERILRSHGSPLAAGDDLELGLLHFEVACEPDAATPARPIASPVPEAMADAVAFDLRDLAVPEEGPGQLPDRARNDDPFGVLDIAGAEASSVADPLAGLLEGTLALPSSAVLASAVALDAPAHAADGRARSPAAALMEGLHAEYVRVVQDPAQLIGRADWERLRAVDGEPAPTLGDLRRDAATYPLLGDILRRREGIDQLLAGFARLGPDPSFETADNEDVLHLFAPELVRSARTAVPSLTRREHHDVSPDSHMRLGATRPDDKDAPCSS